MSRWVDFRELKQSIGIEQVLASYHVELKHVGHNQLRGRCPLPTHGSERSRQSFSVDTAKKVWACHSTSCCEVRQGRVGGNVLDWWHCWRGARFGMPRCACRIGGSAGEPESTLASSNWLQKEAQRAAARTDCRD